MRGYLRELKISDAEFGGSGPELYDLNGPFWQKRRRLDILFR
jgi:hypothetical protein